MNLPEDRHPLLYVYLDSEQQPERIRSRCMSQGATNLLGKWPEHLTSSWLMGVFGLVSLFTCFLMAVVLLVVFSSNHQQKRPFIDKCERNEHVIQLVHMKNLEDLTVNENATYFVEIFTSKEKSQDTACSIESYLRQTSYPVFLVSIFPNKSIENLNLYSRLEQKFKNFKTITFDLNSFFNKTVFASFQGQNVKYLTFLARVLVSWNVGGTVIDSRVKVLKEYQTVLEADERSVVVGTLEEDVVLISSKRFCHVYIFDILKTITENKDILKYSEYDVIKMAQLRYCHGRRNCSTVKLLSYPDFCGWNNRNDNCTFFVPKSNRSMFDGFAWENLCPLIKSFV